VPQRFSLKYESQSGRQSIIDKEQVTAQKCAIRTPFLLIAAGKMPSQMNPLANAMLVELRAVEIQARDNQRWRYRQIARAEAAAERE
jgi:hypothetical protein